MPLTTDDVQQQLDVAGFTSELTELSGQWKVEVDSDLGMRTVFLMYPPDADYLLMATFVMLENVSGRPIERQSAATLARMITASSDVLLSKLTYLQDSHEYLATSECSVDQLTPAKLRRRLEACARLATRLELIVVE